MDKAEAEEEEEEELKVDNDDNDDDASAVATKGKTNKKQKHNISVCCPVLSLSQLFVSQGFTSSVFDTTQPCLDENASI